MVRPYRWLLVAPKSQSTRLGIRQKQIGDDRLTLGGALSANAHGRGLRLPPIVGDVEAFTLIGSRGEIFHCSRTENTDLFGLSIGVYGLFGVIADATLRLAPRLKVRRNVEILTLDELVRVPEDRLRNYLRRQLFSDLPLLGHKRTS